MMQEKTIRTWSSWQLGMTLTAALGLATLGFMAACAGSDTPETDADFRDQLAAQYGNGAGGSKGVGGGSGVGGSSATGSGGSATGAGGGAMAGAAGGGSTVGGTGGSGSATCDGFALIQLKCGGGNCHGAPSAGTLSNFAADAPTAKAYAGQESSMCKATDNSAVFNPDSPANSLVIKKILDTTDCGGRMPLGSTMQALTDDEVDCLEDWIGSLQ